MQPGSAVRVWNIATAIPQDAFFIHFLIAHSQVEDWVEGVVNFVFVFVLVLLVRGTVVVQLVYGCLADGLADIAILDLAELAAPVKVDLL